MQKWKLGNVYLTIPFGKLDDKVEKEPSVHIFAHLIEDKPKMCAA